MRVVTSESSCRIHTSRLSQALGRAELLEDVSPRLDAGQDVRRTNFGHGPPLTEWCNQRLRESQRRAARGPAVSSIEFINQAPVAAMEHNRHAKEQRQ